MQVWFRWRELSCRVSYFELPCSPSYCDVQAGGWSPSDSWLARVWDGLELVICRPSLAWKPQLGPGFQGLRLWDIVSQALSLHKPSIRAQPSLKLGPRAQATACVVQGMQCQATIKLCSSTFTSTSYNLSEVSQSVSSPVSSSPFSLNQWAVMDLHEIVSSILQHISGTAVPLRHQTWGGCISWRW